MSNLKRIIKRDGRTVIFNPCFVENAILKAMNEDGKVDKELATNISYEVERKVDKITNVEKVQDLVEEMLMEHGAKSTAKVYILYRSKRDKARNSQSNNVISDIIAAKSTDITRENANMNAETPAGMMMKVASERTKEYANEFLLSDKTKKLVKSNIIHIHDLDYYASKSTTCLQHPIDKILNGGFQSGHGESRPSKRIETASIIGCISMETIQNEQHGGQSIPAFDFYLAPFVKKTFVEEIKKQEEVLSRSLSHLYDAKVPEYIIKPLDGLSDDNRVVQHAINETTKRVHQSMEAFVHNMNSIHSRGGNQVVFSSINYGTDTSAEGRCIIRELLNTTYRGVGNGSTAIFPIQIWKKKRGVSYLPEDPNYDLYQLACKVSAKRFFPNFLNLDASFNKSPLWDASDPERYKHEVATMGCRTRVFENRFGDKTSVGRGNLSFTTINLPRLAIMAKNAYPEESDFSRRIHFFTKSLFDVAENVAEQLNERFKFQSTALAKQFPMLMSGMWVGSEKLAPNDTVEGVLNQGTLGIGFIGLAECLVALCGKHHGESEYALGIGYSIVHTLAATAESMSCKYKHNYSVLATPAEGLSGKFTKRDRKDFGIIEGVTDRDYYTNSNHVPVYYKCSAKKKAKIESHFHQYTLGGHIFYVELDGDATHNPQAIMDVVDLMDKYNIGYGSINHNRNRCVTCGFENAEKEMVKCPSCGSDDVTTIQRITGYLVGTTDRWNGAKQSELKDRVTHG